jgi:hypothetical protein
MHVSVRALLEIRSVYEMYVHVCVCMHASSCACIFVCMHVSLCACMCVGMHTSSYACIHKFVHACMSEMLHMRFSKKTNSLHTCMLCCLVNTAEVPARSKKPTCLETHVPARA